MPTTYHKLIRDRIPEIIRASGRDYTAVAMPEAEYRQALLEKLQEEANEAAEGAPEQLVAELADLFEVIDAILLAHGIDRQTVLAEQQRRREERGGFARRLRLLWTD